MKFFRAIQFVILCGMMWSFNANASEAQDCPNEGTYMVTDAAQTQWRQYCEKKTTMRTCNNVAVNVGTRCKCVDPNCQPGPYSLPILEPVGCRWYSEDSACNAGDPPVGQPCDCIPIP